MEHTDSSLRCDSNEVKKKSQKKRKKKNSKKHQELQQNDSLIQSNLSGLKSALHGTSYQLKLGIVVCMANAKRSMDPTNKFTFTVTAEDPEAGKFDDIVYDFQDGVKTGTLKIQAKHKLGSPPPKITLEDLLTTKDTKNPFAILKYFTSFYDQTQTTADMEGLIICTNSDISEGAHQLWQAVEPDFKCVSLTSLDSYISTLFATVGGRCYRLNYDILNSSSFSKFFELLRQCSKRTRLAKLLVKAIKSEKDKITRYSLFKDYRSAILNIMDRKDISTNGTYGFTNEFLDSSSLNSSPGYEAFRNEFEEQYRQEFQINGCVWDDLKYKRVYVAEAFMTDANDAPPSTMCFPDDSVDDSINSFCQRFRLWCDTKNEHELDDAIVKLWRKFNSCDDHSSPDKRKGYVEENVVAEKLFKTNYQWLMDPFAKPLHSDDFANDLRNIKNTLAHIKLKGTSDKLVREIVKSPFRIRPDALKESELYELVETENIVEVESYDVQFCATLLSDILDLQEKDLSFTLFFNDSEFIEVSNTVEEVIRSIDYPVYLIITCNEAFKTVHSCIRKWKKDILKDAQKQVFLIKTTKQTDPTDLDCFRICDVTNESWQLFLDKDIPLCTTNISSAAIFQNNLDELSIEEVIEVLDLGKQMENNNAIVMKYQQIESTYVQRHWMNDKDEVCEHRKISWYSVDNEKMFKIIKHIRNLQDGDITFEDIINRMQVLLIFENIFKTSNSNEIELMDSKGKTKVCILLGEAGFGKSTNLTWLAWRLRQRNPSSWVVRCNLSDHCTIFKRFMEGSWHQNEMLKRLSENAALSMLYELIHLSLIELRSGCLQIEQQNAQILSKCVVLSEGSATLNQELIQYHGVSLNNSIQLLVFIEKFNARQLVLLFDGFDEISPHYKEVVLWLLSRFEQFYGVRKLYLTTRPYSFEGQFRESFEYPSFYRLIPLSLPDKGSILYKMMSTKFHGMCLDDNRILDLYKVLCITLLYRLGQMSDIPLNLMTAVDILVELAAQYINFPSKSIDLKLFDEIERKFNPSFIVEEFVASKIRYSMYTKIGADCNVAVNPSELERVEKALDEVKLLHGLVALWVLFIEKERVSVLSQDEIREATEYMNKINEAREKTGIINGVRDGVPIFIHRTFAEYLAAWWIVEQQKKGNPKSSMIFHKPGYGSWDTKDLRRYIDVILTKNHPLHLAIIERNWKTAKSLLSSHPEVVNEKDGGGRTPLQLLMCRTEFHWYYGFLLSPVGQSIANAKEMQKMVRYNALDAFFTDKRPIIENALYDLVDAQKQISIDESALYAKHIIDYLSQRIVEYDPCSAQAIMKQFCDQVVFYLAYNYKESSFLRNGLFSGNKTQQLEIENVIRNHSVNLLDYTIQLAPDPRRSAQIIMDTFFMFLLEYKSIFVLKSFVENDPSLLSERVLRRCIWTSLFQNHTNEFKWFFDLYCNHKGIKDFRACSIQDNNSTHLIFHAIKDNDVWKVVLANEKIITSIPAPIEIDKTVLCVLVLSLVSGRSSILQYVVHSCQIRVFKITICYFALLISKTSNEFMDENRKLAYEYLLNHTSDLRDTDANETLRNAITSDLYNFSICIVERYNIDFEALDSINDWNIFHLCVSRPSSSNDDLVKSMLELFRVMLSRTEMDCIDIFDRYGRSILHLAIENGHDEILKYIVAHKLHLDHIDEMHKLSVDAIPNLMICYRAIHKISKSIQKKQCWTVILCILAEQIAKISLATNHDESTNQPSGSVLLQEDAADLYQVAVEYNSLFLMYYLHREIRCTVPRSMNDAHWLACIAKSLKSPNLRLFQWMVSQYCIEHHITFPYANDKDEIYDCFLVDQIECEQPLVNFEQLVRQAEAKLSDYRSKEDVCIMKLLVLAIMLKLESAIRYLCETFILNIDRKVLLDIIEIAHQDKESFCCERLETNLEPIFHYLIAKSSNLYEIDTENRDFILLAAQSKLSCMVKFLIKHNLTDVTVINMQSRLNVFEHFVSEQFGKKCCGNVSKDLFTFITEWMLQNDDADDTDVVEMALQRQQRIKKLCFNSNDERKSIMQIAVDAGDIRTVERIICLYLGTNTIDKRNIRTVEDCSNYRECYDLLNQIVAQRPFNANIEILLNRMANRIENYWFEIVEPLLADINVENHVKDDIYRKSIKYRSISTLELLMIWRGHIMVLSSDEVSCRELLLCMMECIRRNRTSLFKVLIDHYYNLSGKRPCVKLKYEKEEYLSEDNFRFDEDNIQWSTIDQLAKDLPIDRDYLPILILSVAYGRYAMTRYMVQMLRLVINEELILLILETLNMNRIHCTHCRFSSTAIEQCKAMTPIYEELLSISEGHTSILQLCVRTKNVTMIKYLIGFKHVDPSEVDCEELCEDHDCKSGPACIANSHKAFELLADPTNFCLPFEMLLGKMWTQLSVHKLE